MSAQQVWVAVECKQDFVDTQWLIFGCSVVTMDAQHVWAVLSCHWEFWALGSAVGTPTFGRLVWGLLQLPLILGAR